MPANTLTNFGVRFVSQRRYGGAPNPEDAKITRTGIYIAGVGSEMPGPENPALHDVLSVYQAYYHPPFLCNGPALPAGVTTSPLW